MRYEGTCTMKPMKRQEVVVVFQRKFGGGADPVCKNSGRHTSKIHVVVNSIRFQFFNFSRPIKNYSLVKMVLW